MKETDAVTLLLERVDGEDFRRRRFRRNLKAWLLALGILAIYVVLRWRA